MKRMTLIAAAALAALLAGCNTIEGMGKDIQRAGQAIEDSSKKK